MTETDNKSTRSEPEDDKVKGSLNRGSISIVAPFVGKVSLATSWERRWQTVAMFTCSLYFILPSMVSLWIFTLWTLSKGTSSVVTGVVAMYVGYVFILDKAPTNGTRTPWLRNLCPRWWQKACDYLPLLLVKTADLPVDKGQKYILGYHPHGVISVGCFCAFATSGARTMDLTTVQESEIDQRGEKKKTGSMKGKGEEEDNKKEANLEPEKLLDMTKETKRGFSALFPGLNRNIVTLPQNFQTPFLREYFLSMGAVTSAKETFRTILKRPRTALVVVVGGAAESMHTSEGTMDLVLGSRKGFCREAIMAQASLVPVLAFGENDLYKVVEPSDSMAKVQSFVKKMTGFGMPIFQGRSILFKEVGIMPKRKAVVVVVGPPLPPPKIPSEHVFSPQIDRTTGDALNEDGKLVNQFHSQYVQALQELYDKHHDAPWNVPGHDLKKSMSIIK